MHPPPPHPYSTPLHRGQMEEVAGFHRNRKDFVGSTWRSALQCEVEDAG